MATNFIGCMVSIDCGNVLGIYQGLLDAVNTSTQALTIVQPFHNGTKCQVPRVTITASDIQDLKIVKDAHSARTCNTSNNIHVTRLQNGKKNVQDSNKSVTDGQISRGVMAMHVQELERSSPRTASSKDGQTDYLLAVPNNGIADCHQGQSSSGGNARKSTVNFVCGPQLRQSPNRRTNNVVWTCDNDAGRLQYSSKGNCGRMKSSPVNGTSGSHQATQSGLGAIRRNDYSMPNCESDLRINARKRTTSACDLYSVQKNGHKGNGSKVSERHGTGSLKENDCFAMPVDSFVSAEFDFEKNLAMFDKRAVFNEIERDLEQSCTPSLSKPANATAPVTRSADAKYRCDENVLPTNKTTYRQIAVVGNCNSFSREYVTDSGLVIPSVLPMLRARLFELSDCVGFNSQRRIEMVGRSTAEMVLQLLGGGNRFDPKNSHQRPRVVVLCGSGHQSAIGINCARHLVNRNIYVTILIPNSISVTLEMEAELRLIEFGSCANKTSSCRDLPKKPVDMIISGLDNHESSPSNAAPWLASAVEWANSNKASILAIDPPLGKIGVAAKWSIAVALPFAFDESCGQIYLCDLGLPQKLYHEAGLSVYQSPFAHKFVIPLHVS